MNDQLEPSCRIETLQQTERRMKNRRKMAWLSFIFSLALTVLVVLVMLYLWIKGSNTVQSGSEWAFLLLSVLGLCWSPCFAYLGISTIDDFKHINKNN